MVICAPAQTGYVQKTAQEWGLKWSIATTC